ncbi:MAG: hypothetical protein AB1540_01680 [Bdellovibrionota bacterium]
MKYPQLSVLSALAIATVLGATACAKKETTQKKGKAEDTASAASTACSNPISLEEGGITSLQGDEVLFADQFQLPALEKTGSYDLEKVQIFVEDETLNARALGELNIVKGAESEETKPTILCQEMPEGTGDLFGSAESPESISRLNGDYGKIRLIDMKVSASKEESFITAASLNVGINGDEDATANAEIEFKAIKGKGDNGKLFGENLRGNIVEKEMRVYKRADGRIEVRRKIVHLAAMDDDVRGDGEAVMSISEEPVCGNVAPEYAGTHIDEQPEQEPELMCTPENQTLMSEEGSGVEGSIQGKARRIAVYTSAVYERIDWTKSATDLAEPPAVEIKGDKAVKTSTTPVVSPPGNLVEDQRKGPYFDPYY